MPPVSCSVPHILVNGLNDYNSFSVRAITTSDFPLFLSLPPFLLSLIEVMMKIQDKDLFVLQDVTINTNNYQVDVTCDFKKDSSLCPQCVIVIRKFTEVTLMIEIYPQSTDFPVTLNISEPGHYSVAVFGWSEGMIEPLPTKLQHVDITGTSEGDHTFLPLETYIAGNLEPFIAV